MAKSTTKINIKEALLYGWNTFKKNWQFLVLVFIIVFIAGAIPNFLHDWADRNAPSLRFIFTIAGWIVKLITGIGIIVISLKFVDGKKPKMADIYEHYPLFLNYFLGSLLYGAIVVAGLVLLVVPGIIWGIKYQFMTYLIIDKKMSPMESLRISGKMTHGVKMKLFFLGLVFISLTVLGLITFGIGLLVVWPVISLAGAYVYRKLYHASI